MPFTSTAKNEVLNAVDKMTGKALRVLAVAMQPKGNLTAEDHMTFLGLVGMVEPPR